MPKTSVKDAIRHAKVFVADVMAEENPTNIGLEEVEFSERDNAWLITIGFSRPWNSGVITAITGSAPDRSYRLVKINDETGEANSLTRRTIAGNDA